MPPRPGKPAIDEVQRLPQINLALKRIVDHDRRPGQFILTGPSDIFAKPAAMDSLAGRVSALTLYPLSAAEIQRGGACRLLDAASEDPKIVRSGFPEIRSLNGTDRVERIVAEAPGRILALFEMKPSMTVDRSDFRHFDWFLTEGPGQAHRGAGFVIYLGDQLLS